MSNVDTDKSVGRIRQVCLLLSAFIFCKKRGESMDKLYIIIPAYNEQDNIARVIEQWYPVVEKTGNSSRLVIIDDGSSDNTYKIISEWGGEDRKPLLILLSKPNSGHGATVLYGYKYAVKKKGNKRALRVYDTLEEAETHLKQDEGLELEVRKKKKKKCLEYCSCCEFCNYWKENYGIKENE